MGAEPGLFRSATSSPYFSVSELDRQRQELEILCDALTSCPIGDQVTAPRPVLSSPQYGFFATIIWLSSWLDEAWAASLDFLYDQAERVGVNTDEQKRFRYSLGRLRTFFAHNLDPNTSRDRNTLDHCYRWFKEACGSRLPSEDQWSACLNALLESAVRYMSLAIEIARAIEVHADNEDLAKRWKNRLSRTGVLVDYFDFLQRAAGDLGLEGMDLRNVQRRYRSRWDKGLTLSTAEADADDVTARYMERTLLSETVPLLPVTARNIMENLQLQPGQSVAVALRLAQVIHDLQPTLDRSALLQALADGWAALKPA